MVHLEPRNSGESAVIDLVPFPPPLRPNLWGTNGAESLALTAAAPGSDAPAGHRVHRSVTVPDGGRDLEDEGT